MTRAASGSPQRTLYRECDRKLWEYQIILSSRQKRSTRCAIGDVCMTSRDAERLAVGCQLNNYDDQELRCCARRPWPFCGRTFPWWRAGGAYPLQSRGARRALGRVPACVHTKMPSSVAVDTCNGRTKQSMFPEGISTKQNKLWLGTPIMVSIWGSQRFISKNPNHFQSRKTASWWSFGLDKYKWTTWSNHC